MANTPDRTTELKRGSLGPMHNWAVVLAGGDGTRLTELSLKISGDRRPKQFCAFFGGKTLLAHTRERLRQVFLGENTLFVVNRAHQPYYREALSDVPSGGNLIQPGNRGTAPAIMLAVLKIIERDPHATVAFFPSDHHYSDVTIFQATVNEALRLARDYPEHILVVGAPASYPEVEYGWIEPGRTLIPHQVNPLRIVTRFWEKPNLATAHELQATGCLWNTFVVIGCANAFLRLFAATVPDLLDAITGDHSNSTLDRIYAQIEPADFSKQVLATAPNHLLVLQDGPSGWTDLGSPKRALNLLDVSWGGAA